MPDDHPKFGAFYTWAQQLDPRAKKRARSRNTPHQPAPPEPPPRLFLFQRFYRNNRTDVRSFLVQLLVGLILTGITLTCTLGRSESAAPPKPTTPAHTWDQNMTITPEPAR